MTSFTSVFLILCSLIIAPAAGVRSAQDKPAKAVLVSGSLVGGAGAPLAGTLLNACPEGDPGKPMLLRGWPIVLDGAEATTDADGRFAFEFYPEGDQVRLAKTRLTTNVRLRICIVPKGKAEYHWVGPWLDLKKLQGGTPINLGKVTPED